MKHEHLKLTMLCFSSFVKLRLLIFTAGSLGGVSRPKTLVTHEPAEQESKQHRQADNPRSSSEFEECNRKVPS